MERTDKNIAMNQGKYEDKHGRCIEEGRWPETLSFDANDEELVAFYDHAEICPFHSEIVKVANTDFARSLIQFNCRLRASAKPKYAGHVTLVRLYNGEELDTSDKGMGADD